VLSELGPVLAEINQLLDFVQQEEVSRLSREKDDLVQQLARSTAQLETTRAELDGIKSTAAYKIYRKIRGTPGKTVLEG
jgi:hypothetical protein